MSFSSVLTVVYLACVPAGCMLVATLTGMLWIQISYRLAGALQHFAAGVLLSTIGTELLAHLLAADGWSENIGLTVGFFGGMATLIVLGIVMPDTEEEEASINIVASNSSLSDTPTQHVKKERRPTGAEGVLAHSLRRKSSSMTRREIGCTWHSQRLQFACQYRIHVATT